MHHHPPTLLSQILPALFPVFLYMPVILGIPAKTKSRIFCLRETGVGGGGVKSRSSSIPQKCSILFDEKSEYYHELEAGFKVQGGWGGGDFAIVSRRQNMRDFFLQIFLSE